MIILDPVVRVTLTKIAKAKAASHAPNVKITTHIKAVSILREEETAPAMKAKESKAISKDNKHIKICCRCKIRVSSAIIGIVKKPQDIIA